MDNSEFNKTGLENQSGDQANRPRLRKIKRPKQRVAPITNQDFADALRTNNAPNIIPSASGDSAVFRATDINKPTQDIPQTYAGDNQHPYQTDEEYYPEDYAYPKQNKKLIWIAVACLFVGLFLGKLVFSGGNVVQNGLQGVVPNPEVPKGRSRCGVVEKTQGCVLYIMNPQRQEMNGRAFFDLASQLTGRQNFVIETGNMRYASVKIKPGNIAQLNIPPL